MRRPGRPGADGALTLRGRGQYYSATPGTAEGGGSGRAVEGDGAPRRSTRGFARSPLRGRIGPEEIAIAAGAIGALAGAAGAGAMVDQTVSSGFFKALLVMLTAAIGCIVCSSSCRGLMLAWGGPQIFQNGVAVAPHRPPRPQGLAPGTIREMLPAEPYALPPLGERSPSFTAPECTICLENLIEGDEVRRLKCGHVFHAECIDSWLVKVAACPLCRVHPITGGLDHPEEQEMVEVHVHAGPEASSAAALADLPGPSSRHAAAGGSSSGGSGSSSGAEEEETEGEIYEEAREEAVEVVMVTARETFEEPGEAAGGVYFSAEEDEENPSEANRAGAPSTSARPTTGREGRGTE